MEAPAVFEDIFAGVPFREAEVEDLLYFFLRDRRAVDQRADAAGPRAEAVDQPGELV